MVVEIIAWRNQMRLRFIKFLVFVAAILSGVGFYDVSTRETQSEILSLTEKFHEAYKEQDEHFINHILADDEVNTSDNNNGSYGKSDFLDGLRSHKTDKIEIVSIEITPIWIQGDRKIPSFTFESRGTILIEGKPSTYYGQYTFIFEKRQANWQIVSMNFDINYRETKPYWLAKRTLSLARVSKGISNWFSNS